MRKLQLKRQTSSRASNIVNTIENQWTMPLPRSRKRKCAYVSTACQTSRIVIVTPKRTRPSRVKHVTPPKALSSEGHHTIPQRTGVFLCREISYLQGIKLPAPEAWSLVGVSPRRQSEILKSGEVRMLNHSRTARAWSSRSTSMYLSWLNAGNLRLFDWREHSCEAKESAMARDLPGGHRRTSPEDLSLE